jgi:F0F1-type ATP synthase membrane subunit b/b'
MSAWLTGFLTNLLRPIIKELIDESRVWFEDQIKEIRRLALESRARLEDYKKYDEEAQELINEMARSNTSEERWAILQRIRNARPVL